MRPDPDPRPFLEFAARNLDAAPAQRAQDLFALWVSGLATSGWFVEFGALGGKNVSNSWILEQIGWSGIVAEPHPDFATALRNNRRCHVDTDCVWTTTGDTVTFHAVVGRPALSGIAGLDYDDVNAKAGRRDTYREHRVPTVSLVDLLDRHGAPPEIDFLSIDTEGSELAILGAYDFSRAAFGVIVVEHSWSSAREPIFDLLTPKGYRRIWTELSGHDDWYVHSDYITRIDAAPERAEEMAARLSAIDGEGNLANRAAALSEMAAAAGCDALALETAEKAARLAPTAPRILGALAERATAMGRIDIARQALERLLELQPESTAAQRALQALAGR